MVPLLSLSLSRKGSSSERSSEGWKSRSALPNAVMLYAYAWGSSVEYGFNTQKLMEQ